METITITLSEEKAAALRDQAAEYNLSTEELILQGVDQVLAQTDEGITRIATYVAKKNEELYRRLA